jgi:hypothetical protein
MQRGSHSWTMGLTIAAMALSGCASDDVQLPEAELVTPGAFVAVRGYDPEHEFTLIRTIDRLDFEFETLLFFSTYDVNPTSWDDARELAKKHDLPLRQEIEAQPTGAITQRTWQVVWFRTLTAEEEERVK